MEWEVPEWAACPPESLLPLRQRRTLLYHTILTFIHSHESRKAAPSRNPAAKGMQLKAKSTQSDQYLKALADLGEIGEDAYASTSDPRASASVAVDKKG